MRTVAIIGLVLLVPNLTTNADYQRPPSSWHKPLPSFENRRLHLVPVSLPDATTTDERVERSVQAYRAMHALGKYIDKQRIRLQLLDVLLGDPEIPALAAKTLTDHQFAKNAYKEDQAIARVYSIELLARKADLGDPLPLFKTAQELTLLLDAQEEPTKGELRDLEDLLFEYLRRSDLSDVRSTLKNFQYSARLKVTFMDALSFALKGKLSDAQIQEIHEEL